MNENENQPTKHLEDAAAERLAEQLAARQAAWDTAAGASQQQTPGLPPAAVGQPMTTAVPPPPSRSAGCMGLVMLMFFIGWIGSLFDSPSPSDKLPSYLKGEARAICDENEEFADDMDLKFDYQDCLDSYAKAHGYK